MYMDCIGVSTFRSCNDLPASILSVSYGYERLEVGSLQAILKQLLGCIDILWDTFHTLVQYPWALADLALDGT